MISVARSVSETSCRMSSRRSSGSSSPSCSWRSSAEVDTFESGLLSSCAMPARGLVVRLGPLGGDHLAGRPDGARRDGLDAVLVVRVGDAAGVHQLGDDVAAL